MIQIYNDVVYLPHHYPCASATSLSALAAYQNRLYFQYYSTLNLPYYEHTYLYPAFQPIIYGVDHSTVPATPFQPYSYGSPKMSRRSSHPPRRHATHPQPEPSTRYTQAPREQYHPRHHSRHSQGYDTASNKAYAQQQRDPSRHSDRGIQQPTQPEMDPKGRVQVEPPPSSRRQSVPAPAARPHPADEPRHRPRKAERPADHRGTNDVPRSPPRLPPRDRQQAYHDTTSVPIRAGENPRARAATTAAAPVHKRKHENAHEHHHKPTPRHSLPTPPPSPPHQHLPPQHQHQLPTKQLPLEPSRNPRPRSHSRHRPLQPTQPRAASVSASGLPGQYHPPEPLGIIKPEPAVDERRRDRRRSSASGNHVRFVRGDVDGVA